MTGVILPGGLGFRLAVPPSWWELDLRPATRASSLDALVEQQVRDVPALREHRTALARLLREQARSAWDAGASYAAVMAEPTDEGPVTACIALLVVPGPVPTDGRDRLARVMEPFTASPRAGADGTWRSVEVVDVPGAGRAARTWGVEDVALPGGAGRVRQVLMQTWAPLPGVDRVLVVSCASPVLPLVDDLLDLFDAVSGALAVTSSGPDAG